MKTYKFPVLFILALIIIVSCASGAQNTASIVASFNGNFVPVQQVVESGDSILVKYNVDLAIGPDAFKDDIPYILGTIARVYPTSKTIRIDCFVGDDPIRYYEVKTADVIGYAQGSLSDSQIVASIQPKTPDASMKSGIQSTYKQVTTIGLFQIPGILILALEQAGTSIAAFLMAVICIVVITAAVIYASREIRGEN